MNETTTVNRTIFLVDDDAAVCHSLSVLLNGSGYDVRSFLSAEAFLDEADSLMQGVILLDQCMNGMTGLELQTELSRRGFTLPVIFITANIDEQIHAEAIQCGAINILKKPFSNNVLIGCINEALSNAKAK